MEIERNVASPAGLQNRLAAVWQFLNGMGGGFETRVLRAGVWVGAASFSIRLVEFTRSIVLARLLMPEVFGLMGITSFLIKALEAFTQTGYGAALVHRQERAAEAYDTLWVISIIRGFLRAGAVALAAPYVADFYHEPALDGIIKVVALCLLVQGFSNVNMVRYRMDLDFKKITLVNQTTTLLGTLVIVGLAWWLRNVWALAIGKLASALLAVCLSYLAQPLWPRFRFRRRLARELYHYGKFLTGGAIVVFLCLQLDNAVVGKLLSMKALGFYVMAYALANMPATHISSVVSAVMFPSYCKIQANMEHLRLSFHHVLALTAALTMPAAVALASLAPDIVRVVYGPNWLPMVRALQLLCIHGFFMSLAAVGDPLFRAMGKPQYEFLINLMRLGVIVVTIVPLTHALGIEGAAISVSLAAVLACVPFLVLLARILGQPILDLLRGLLLPLAASGAVAVALHVASWHVGHQSAYALFLKCSIGLSACLLVLSLGCSYPRAILGGQSESRS